MPSELLTAKEAADLLRVSRGTVTRWVRLGQLQAVRLPSGGIRIPRAEIDRILSKGQP